jgi:hypothetical protein
VTAMPPLSKRMEKLTWLQNICIILIFLVAAGEIFVIRHADQGTTEQRKSDNATHLQELQEQQARFAEQMASLWGFRESIERKISDVNVLLKKARLQPTPDTFKVQVLQLVRDVFQFSAEMEKQQPVYSTSVAPADRQRESEAFDRWRNETIAGYINGFNPRIVATAEQIRARGIDTGHFLFACLKPVNTLMIPTCANELQGLASKLP